MNNTLNCVILHQKCRFLTKEKRRKSLICSVLLILTFGSSGATGNRTRDTRIFSPLLYQLSYGTSLYVCFGFQSECKGNHFFQLCKGLMQFFSFFILQAGESGGVVAIFRGTLGCGMLMLCAEGAPHPPHSEHPEKTKKADRSRPAFFCVRIH